MSIAATPVPLGSIGIWAHNRALNAERAEAIERLGYGAIWIGGSPEAGLLAVEHKVVLETDPGQTRAQGRPAVEKPYLGLRNYVNNLGRLGYSDADLADGGSDRLIDALVAQGTEQQTAATLRAHLDTGADHVAVHAVPDDVDPLPTLTRLAPALGLAQMS